MSTLQLPDDGRNLDPALADVTGIAADQKPLLHPDRAMPGAGAGVWQGQSPRDTYYDQPVVKSPPWGSQVSAYLVAGGVAGTAAALGSAAEGRLRKASTALAFVAGAAGAGLLVSDLGRPARFLHMVRVVKPTSVMNIGGFLLSTTTGAAAAGVILPGRLGSAARTTGAVSGLPLAAYTGVLLSATAVPGWNVGISTLPPLFLASGAATTGSVLRLVPLDERERSTVAVYTAVSQTAELVAGEVHTRRFKDKPRVRSAYEAVPGWRLGKWLTAASLVLGVSPLRHKTSVRVAAGLLGVAGSAMTKTAVFDAGMRTAVDPHAVPESGR